MKKKQNTIFLYLAGISFLILSMFATNFFFFPIGIAFIIIAFTSRAEKK